MHLLDAASSKTTLQRVVFEEIRDPGIHQFPPLPATLPERVTNRGFPDFDLNELLAPHEVSEKESLNSLRVRCSFSIAAIRAKVSYGKQSDDRDRPPFLTLIEAPPSAATLVVHVALETTTWSSGSCFRLAWSPACAARDSKNACWSGYCGIATNGGSAARPFAIGLCLVGPVLGGCTGRSTINLIRSISWLYWPFALPNRWVEFLRTNAFSPQQKVLFARTP